MIKLDNFIKYDFKINKIQTALLVPKGTGDAVHRNRLSHGLAFNSEGEKIYSFKSGKHIIVKQNDIIYLPKHSYYTVSNVFPGDCYAINFDIDEEVNFPPLSFRTKNFNMFIDFFKKAQKSWEKKDEGFSLNCKAQLYNILYYLRKEYFSDYISSNKLALILPAVEYIHLNYSAELLRVEKLAAMCNITPEYFRSIFKSNYGVSPSHYINNLKITKAKELLDSQMYPITVAANLSGYVDISHFSREFKRHFGLSPREYQKQKIE